MKKSEAIRQLNEQFGSKRLSSANTHWSNVINYSSDQGWWLNIAFHKFKQDLNLILNDEKAGVFLHVEIPANSIPDPENVFRNKEGEADIFMPHTGRNRLIDTQAKSGRHDFRQYRSTEYPHR